VRLNRAYWELTGKRQNTVSPAAGSSTSLDSPKVTSRITYTPDSSAKGQPYVNNKIRAKVVVGSQKQKVARVRCRMKISLAITKKCNNITISNANFTHSRPRIVTEANHGQQKTSTRKQPKMLRWKRSEPEATLENSPRMRRTWETRPIVGNSPKEETNRWFWPSRKGMQG
jgi:hypothetical protein